MQQPIVDAIPWEEDQMDTAVDLVAGYIGSTPGEEVFILVKPGENSDFEPQRELLAGIVQSLRALGKRIEWVDLSDGGGGKQDVNEIFPLDGRILVVISKLYRGNEIVPFLLDLTMEDEERDDGEKMRERVEAMTRGGKIIGVVEGVHTFPALHPKGERSTEQGNYFLKHNRGILVVAPLNIVDYITGELMGVLPSRDVRVSCALDSSEMWVRRARWLGLRTM